MQHQRVFNIVCLALIMLCLPAAVLAQTPTPEWVNFYSASSTLDGKPVPVGAVVEAFDPGGVLCGRYVVQTAGSYGYMPCYLDDLASPKDEGIRPGDTVQFKINGLSAGQFAVPLVISMGQSFRVDLAAMTPPPVGIPEPMTLVSCGLAAAGMAGYFYRRRLR